MRLVRHIGLMALAAAVWVGIANATDGLAWDIVIVLACVHTGVVTHRQWPTK